MKKVSHGGFRVMGMKITTNNKQAFDEKTIEEAWEKFMSEQVFTQIPGCISDEIYAVYCNFEEGFESDSMNKNYDLIIGCKVNGDVENISGLSDVFIPGNHYACYEAKGKMPDCIIDTWQTIWNDETIVKNYSFDYEVYGKKSQNGDKSEAEIYVGIET